MKSPFQLSSMVACGAILACGALVAQPGEIQDAVQNDDVAMVKAVFKSDSKAANSRGNGYTPL
ncbi:MAG: hypothetical protein N2C14_04925, partial [Planctomycetales bacterium]